MTSSKIFGLLLLSMTLTFPAASLFSMERPSEKIDIPLQNFIKKDFKRFPADLLNEIQEGEKAWGDMLWQHRQQYAAYYQDLLGPGIYCTHDVYLKEMEQMSKPDYYSEIIPPVIMKKSLKRFPDIAWVSSAQIPGLTDKTIENIRLLSFRFGRIQVVPFDIIEGTAEGLKVLPDGPQNNAAEGDGKFNNTDHLVFKAHDCGHKVADRYIQDQYGKSVIPVEIEISDSKTNENGWVYLSYFPATPPAKSLFDYITVHNDTVNQQFSDYIFHQGTFKFKKDKIYRRVFTRTWKYAPYFGHTGDDFFDRMKVRITARLMFGLIKIHFDEDDAAGNWIAWQDGQVVSISRAWLGVALPLGLKSPHLLFDVIASGTVMNVIIDTHVPVNPGHLLTDYTMKIGNDWELGKYQPGEDMDCRFFNSNNREGMSIDGVMSPEEKAWVSSIDNWRIIDGPPGTIIFRSYWDQYYQKQAEISVVYTDDINQPDPPEFHPGQIATLYSISRVKNLKPRDYHLLIDYYGPPHFKNEDGDGYDWDFFNQYINIMDHPVRIKIGDSSKPNWKPSLKFLSE